MVSLDAPRVLTLPFHTHCCTAYPLLAASAHHCCPPLLRPQCPFEAIQIINLPSNLEKETTHRYSANSFKLHRLPMPRPGQVLGLVGTNGIGKSTALKILAGKQKPNLGRFSDPPDWQEILLHFRGSELQNYFTKILEDDLKAIIKPQCVVPFSLSLCVVIVCVCVCVCVRARAHTHTHALASHCGCGQMVGILFRYASNKQTKNQTNKQPSKQLINVIDCTTGTLIRSLARSRAQ
jgi:hypothetical protein